MNPILNQIETVFIPVSNIEKARSGRFSFSFFCIKLSSTKSLFSFL